MKRNCQIVIQLLELTCNSLIDIKEFFFCLYTNPHLQCYWLTFQVNNSLVSKMRPLFVGNIEYDIRQPELERLFSKYGRIERLDMKSGNPFVFFSPSSLLILLILLFYCCSFEAELIAWLIMFIWRVKIKLCWILNAFILDDIYD